MSEADQVKLNNLLNGQGDRTQLQRILGLASGMRTPITEADKGAHLCSLQIGPNAYDGYLLYTDDKCCLVWFTDFQTLSMFDIDVAKQKFAVVSEYLDITELRSSLNILLVEAGHAVKVQADDIDSGVATQGQALVADGNGGAIWGEAAGGGGDFEEIDVRNENGTLLREVYAAIIALHPNGVDSSGNPLYLKIKYSEDDSYGYKEYENLFTVSDCLAMGPTPDNPTFLNFVCFNLGNSTQYLYQSSYSSDLSVHFPGGLDKKILVPVTTPSDRGKVLTVSSGSGQPAWQTPAAGGTQLYCHAMNFSLSGNTVNVGIYDNYAQAYEKTTIRVLNLQGRQIFYDGKFCVNKANMSYVLYYVDNDGTIKNFDLSEYDLVSDVVTPL